MAKNLLIWLSVATMLFAASCSTDPTGDELLNGDNIENGGNTSGEEEVYGEAVAFITVGIDNSKTRISLGEEAEADGKAYIPLTWNEGDRLTINRTELTLPVGAEYDGKETAVIGLSAEVAEKTTYPIVVMYPGNPYTQSSTKHFYIDSEQSYLQGHLSNGYGILMGKAESQEDVITMEHLCGYMKVSLTGSATIKRVMLRTIGHEPLSGYFKHVDTGEIGMTNYVAPLADGYYNSPLIAINCGDGVALTNEPTDFYFAIPAGEYAKGFALSIMDSNGNKQSLTAYQAGKNIEAGVLIKMPAVAVNCTQPWGIYDGNEFASFSRTLEKNAWLNLDGKTISLRGEADLTNEDFSDKTQAIVEFRSNYETYNNHKVKVIDGKKSETENFAITNLKMAFGPDRGLLFDVVREDLTIQNLNLGKTADNPTTDTDEADSHLYCLNINETDYAYLGVFSYKNQGAIKNCRNYATLKVAATASQGIRAGVFSAGFINGNTDGVLENCINYGHINVDGSNSDKENTISGIINQTSSTRTSAISGCKNYGPITVKNASTTTRVAGIVARSYMASENCITSCENHGAISIDSSTGSLYIGGICGLTSNKKNEDDTDINGEGDSISSCNNNGTITITNTSGTNTYVGGIVAHNYSTVKYAITGCENKETATLTVNGASKLFIGGILGGGETGDTLSSCTNNATLNISGVKAGWSYVGGILGQNGPKIYSCCNYGDITVNCPDAKIRVGGLGGYVTTASRADGSTVKNTVECDITVTNAAKESCIGGITGYSNNTTKYHVSYKGTIKNKATNANVYFGGLAGTANGSQWRTCTLSATMVNEGTATFGLIASGAVSSSEYTIVLGSSGNPVNISKQSKFLGTSVTEETVSNGTTPLVSNLPYPLIVSAKNLKYVD